MNDAISRYLTEDHRRCDRLLAECEARIAAKTWQAADEATVAFNDATRRHFAMEEEALFPALEQGAPVAAGPTGVMRMEHSQIRQLLDELLAAVRARELDASLGNIETLHLLSQQHNAKEEGILYPLADRSLPDGTDDLMDRLRAM